MADHTHWQNVLHTTDYNTASLIVQLHAEDVASLATSTRQNEDAELARTLYENDVKELQGELPGRLRGELLEEQDNKHQQSLEAAAFGWKFNQHTGGIEQVAKPPLPTTTCTACNELVPRYRAFKAPCDHWYCSGCLEQLHNACLTDESLFPPRCCKRDFAWESLKPFLSRACKSKFGPKREELQTKDKTYCYIPTCSTFISPDRYFGVLAKCKHCQSNTCVTCKGTFHAGECPRDEAMEVLLTTAATNQWKRCTECKRVIELKSGCNHITCVCRSQWCYVCQTPWKNCQCPTWDENRLIERAGAVVDRVPAVQAAAAAPPAREVQVQQAVDHLRANHECVHERFKGIRGRRFQCEVCEASYRHWIYQCRQCLMIACNTCRHNRL